MPFVRVKSGHNAGKVYAIETEILSLGRDNNTDIQILDEAASRRHAEIFRIGEMCFIRDLKSRNGTYVNENKIDEELLRMGDKIRIGKTVMVFEEQSSEMTDAEDRPNFTFDSGEISGQTMELQLDTSTTMRARKTGPAEDATSTDERHLQVLFQIAKILSSVRNLSTLLKNIIALTLEEMEAESAYIFMKDHAGNLVPKAYKQTRVGSSAVISRSIIKQVLQHGRAVLTSDATLDSRFSAKQSVVINRIKSVICAPLVTHKDITGVLYLNSAPKGKIFTEEDLSFVSTVGMLAGVAIENIIALEKQRKLFMGTIKAMVAAIEMRNPAFQGRSERIGSYAASIAAQLDIGPDEVQGALIAGLLHNIGKIGLSPEQEKDPYAYAEVGARIVENMVGMEDVVSAIRLQHEYANGTGPKGLKGDKIPPLAQVVRLACDLDALLFPVGGDTPTVRDVLVKLGENSDRRYDDRVIRAMIVADRKGTLFSG